MDNRKILENEYWKQGYTIATRITNEWSEERFKDNEYQEKCCAFVRFSCLDEGRSRQFVYKYRTPEKCKKAIDKHNKILNKNKKQI